MHNQDNCFGRVDADVIRNKDIPVTAKAIYSHLAVMCGASDECFPSVETITTELNISRETFYRYSKILIAAGIVEKRQTIRENGQFGNTVYKLTRKEKPYTVKADTETAVNGNIEQTVSGFKEKPYTVKPTTKENKDKEISLKRYQEVVDLYNSICVSFSKVRKLSDSRKKAIHARFIAGYTIEDFRELFEAAEASSFLKGGNDRNWTADFDWLISDRNMAKTIEGKYQDRQSGKEKRDGESTSTGNKLF